MATRAEKKVGSFIISYDRKHHEVAVSYTEAKHSSWQTQSITNRTMEGFLDGTEMFCDLEHDGYIFPARIFNYSGKTEAEVEDFLLAQT